MLIGPYFTVNNMVHILDLLIVWFVLYKIIRFVEGTRALQILVGVGIVIVVKFLSWFLGLVTVAWAMDQVINWAPIGLVVIFQQEIRQGLERVGRQLTGLRRVKHDNAAEHQLIDALDDALQYMSKRRIGALITLAQETNLEEYIRTGIRLDAAVSSQLLINIFIPNTPLHDGAVIINGDKIASAAAYLPLSESTAIPKELGTRHRAAVGISEMSDALTIVVSEETGEISITMARDLMRNMTQPTYRAFFEKQLLTPATDHKRRWWQGVRS